MLLLLACGVPKWSPSQSFTTTNVAQFVTVDYIHDQFQVVIVIFFLPIATFLDLNTLTVFGEIYKL